MMFAGFLFLLLLTGGNTYNHTEPPDAEGVYNQSLSDRGSTYNHTEPPGVEGGAESLLLSWTRPESVPCGSTYNYTEPLEYDYDEDQNQWKSDVPSKCSYIDLVKHFNLTDRVKFFLTRPVRHYDEPTRVLMDIYLYRILDVKEKEQELVAYFWISLLWNNEYISWRLDQFCYMDEVTVPTEMLWKPDLTVEEVTQNDNLFQTQYLSVRRFGRIHQRNGMVLVSTCKMRFYRFPFDTQTCNLTFKSMQHNVYQMELFTDISNEDIFEISRKWMQTESEWLLMNITVETDIISNFDFPLSVLVYTMTMKRRSVLYVANFVVPILFFLCLDLASFLISESGGEKLSFKVTVLLAVTVMQLILNDILPSSSDRIPLIAVYCIGVFTLMMLSLLETILMMYLMEKDDVPQDKEADKDQSLGDNCVDQQGKVQNCFRDNNKSIPCVRVFDESLGETPTELLPEVKEGSSSQLTEEIHDFENLMDELREVLKTMTLLLSSRKEEKEPSYWTRMTKKLNRIYFIFYIIAASVFLGYVFSIWLRVK